MSKQDYGTPIEFVDACAARFGAITHDLAANAANAKAPSWYGEGGIAPDALAEDWRRLPGGVLWLNPPYADIEPWAACCAHYADREHTIVMLTPASIGTEWFAAYVHRRALVLGLSPRIAFEGCSAPYPKDLMIAVYGGTTLPGFDVWRWR